MSEPQSGPIDVIVLGFPGNKFDGGIGPALRDLVLRRWCVWSTCCSSTRTPTARSVRSSWVVCRTSSVRRSSTSMGSSAAACSTPMTSTRWPGTCKPNSSVAVVAVENLWAIPFIDAVRRAGGELIDQARVPSTVVDAVRARRRVRG